MAAAMCSKCGLRYVVADRPCYWEQRCTRPGCKGSLIREDGKTYHPGEIMTKKNRKGFDIEFIHDGIEFCFRDLGFHDLSKYGVQRDSEDANTLIIGEFCVIDTPAPDAVDQRAKILAMYYIPAQTGGRPEDATPADTDFRLISTAHNNEEAICFAVGHVFQRVLDEALYAFGMEWEMSVDESEKLSKVRLRVPDACPGCGKLPGQGLTEDCTHEIGCSYWRKANGGEE